MVVAFSPTAANARNATLSVSATPGGTVTATVMGTGLRQQGDICSVGSDCGTGNCVDGHCCASASCGQCRSCTTGTCALVTYAPDPDTCSDAAGMRCDRDGNCLTRMSEFSVAASTPSGLDGITVGPDGNIWFIDNMNAAAGIGRVSTARANAGTVLLPYVGLSAAPHKITTGPDANLWVTVANSIARVTPAGGVQTFGALAAPATSIVSGPGNSLWFSEFTGINIGKVSLTGEVMEIPIMTPNSSPITIASDGASGLWFSEYNLGKIARFDSTTGQVAAELTVPGSAGVGSITLGPDGNMWFTEFKGNNVSQLKNGLITQFALPTAGGGPEVISTGPAGIPGVLWFTEFNGNKIGRITTGGSITEFSVTTPASEPTAITAGPDGNIWFCEFATGNLGRFVP